MSWQADATTRLEAACGGDWNLVAAALRDLGVELIDETTDIDFLERRVNALREESIVYNWEHEP